MSRPLRIEFPGAVYHLIAHGNGKQWLFKDDHDYQLFLALLESTVNKYGIIPYAYVLMKTHYHLLCETTEANLSEALRYLHTNYSVRFNLKEKRKGNIFRKHYKAIIVEKGTYLLELNRYIHLNPVKIGLVGRPEDYRWSSYPLYLDKNKGGKENDWLDRDWVLSQFGTTETKAVEKYREFVELGLKENTKNSLEEVSYGYILGTEEFIQRILNGLKIKEDKELSGIKKVYRRRKAKEIIILLSKTYRVPEDTIIKDKLLRKVAIYLIYKNTDLRQREIGKIFGNLSYSGVSQLVRRLKEEMKNNHQLKKIFAQIKPEYELQV